MRIANLNALALEERECWRRVEGVVACRGAARIEKSGASERKLLSGYDSATLFKPLVNLVNLKAPFTANPEAW